MRILFLTAYSFPEQLSSSHLGGSRNQAYIRQGWDMVTYTPTPCRGIDEETRKKFSRIKREERYNGHLVVHRFSMFPEGKNPLLRALRYFLCAIKHFNRGVFAKDARSCDVMFIASTPPIQGAMAAMVKKCRKRLKFVYNLQDIFPDSLIGTGLARKGGLLWRVGRVIESFTYNNADKIIVISQDFKKNIMAKGVPENKIEVIYNWVDADIIRPVEKSENPLFEEFGFDRDRFMVVYAGNLGNAQNISILLEAASHLPEVQFAVFGTGGVEEEIRSRINTDNLSNVYLNPLQPYERVSLVYSLGDACIVSCKPGFGGSAMPSKTWTIMSCGRPVIASFDEGELKDIIENNDCGVFSHAGVVNELISAIQYMVNNKEKCKTMGANARRFILENLTKEVGTQKYVDVIKSFEK